MHQQQALEPEMVKIGIRGKAGSVSDSEFGGSWLRMLTEHASLSARSLSKLVSHMPPPCLHEPLLQSIDIYLPQKIKLLKGAVFPRARPLCG